MSIDFLELDIPKKDHCKGLFFRCHVSRYLQANGDVVYKETMAKLKRLSCPGCQDCAFLLDELHDSISDKYMPGPIVEEVVDGGLYRLDTTNQTRDWETGIIDGWDLEFILIERPKV